MEIMKNGMVKMAAAKDTGLPIYDYRVTDNPGHHSDLCDADDFKRLGISLTPYERIEYIKGFVIYENYRGAMPLYSLKELFDTRQAIAVVPVRCGHGRLDGFR